MGDKSEWVEPLMSDMDIDFWRKAPKDGANLAAISEEPGKDQGSPKSILKNPLEDPDRNMESPTSEASLAETVARMMVREQTFLTELGEGRTESRRGSDFDGGSSGDEDDDDFVDDVSDYDENHNSDFRRRGRRKSVPFEFDIDADFNFDQDDEEDIRRRSKKRKITTDMVYSKACENCRLPPCGAFREQATKVSVCLRGMHLGPKEIKPIAISLVKDRTIVVLDLSDNNMGPVGVMYIAEMMQANRHLIELNLSQTNPCRSGLGALAETLRLNNSIRVLKLEENDIDHTDALDIASIIKSCPKLQELHLGHNRLGAAGGKVIAEALITSTGLRTLDLQWNHLRRESAVELSKALAKNKSLKLLNVAWNGFAKEGCLALAKALKVNSSLQELDLTCNRIDFQSLSFLAHGLVLNKGLHTVKLGHNPMTTDGANQLLKAMADCKESQLTELSLEDIPVDAEFIKTMNTIQATRNFKVIHGHVMKLATGSVSRDHDGTSLTRWEPTLVLFEYMRMDNLRLIDMFKSFDTKKRDKLSRTNLKDGINTLKIPFTEHMLDEIMEKLDVNKDGVIDLEEMMKGAKDMSRYVNQRTLKAKAKKREDMGLVTLRQTLKKIIKKRKEDQDQAAQNASRDRRKSMMEASGLPGLAGIVRKMQIKKSTGITIQDPEVAEMNDVEGMVKLAAMKFRRKLKKPSQPATISEDGETPDSKAPLTVAMTTAMS
ncbi:leucine-rich repeat-containing protein 74A-like isoform X1 [Haliotis cracherodii]|uniref:leucine-rich repeat-containing protein 74A-like isoform X1 n=1 Tax=Haliotis cracherodii TaxID=6455 RepID=UPI0039E96236